MEDLFLKKLKEYNLSTWFILPLIDGLNRASFGVNNFIDSYLSSDHTYLVVQVIDFGIYSDPVSIEECAWKVGEINRAGMSLVIFRIDDQYNTDIGHFVAGRYSKFSDETKTIIRKNSGLQYEIMDSSGNLYTDDILMALDKHPALKKKWTEELDMPTFKFPPETELLSVPSEQCFIDLDTL